MSTTTAPATKRKQRVFVVDDHPIVRQGLALLINQEPDLTVCGEAEEAESILASIVQLEPDIIVLDISLPGSDGIDALKAIRSNHADLPVLILSMHDESIYAERALRAGANGYIMKQEATDTVLVALRRILAGEVYISDRATSKMLQRIVARPATRQRTSVASLSDRELEVFRLIGSGLGTREIAEKLQLSAKTVESYQAHIKKRLSLPTARALVQRAIEWKISEGTA
jgi:DNA-binding NarL/FixJ family response regulator